MTGSLAPQPILLTAAIAILGAIALWLAGALLAPFTEPAAGFAEVRGPRLEAAPAMDARALRERPPFRANRRPAANAAPVAASRKGGFPETLRLTATLLSAGGETAIFVDTASGEAVSVRLSGTIGGWTITQIRADRVEVLGPSGALTLYLGAEQARP